MAMWPFRRKSGRKRARSGTTLSDSEGVAYGDRVPHPRSHVANSSTFRRRSTLKKRRTEPTPTAANPRPRKNSFSPGRADSIHVDYRRRRDMTQTDGIDPLMRPNGSRSNERIEEEIMRTGAPTLHGKGGSRRLTKRKSSKRRRTDHDREAEIKAMTSPSRTRSKAEARNFTRPTRTSSKRVKTGPPLGRTWEHPSSDLSLPSADSIRSGMSSDSDHGAFRLATLASLAPHPTLRYVVSPRESPSPQPPSRSGSQKRKLAERPPVEEDLSRSRKRIDDLADDFDTSDIRELMERDKRRRERKKLRDQARAERRITRMAEERKAAQAKAAQEGSPPPPNLERGVAGRELPESGTDATSAVVTSSRFGHADRGQPQPEESSGGAVPETGSQHRAGEPLRELHDTNNIARDTITPQDGPEGPAVEPYAPPSPTSPVFGKFLKSKKNASKSSLGPGQSKSTLSSPAAKLEEVKTSQSEGLRKVRMSISSLFRWGTRRNRQSSGPSSFSNTSREEMQAAAQASQAQAATSTSSVPPVAATADSGVSVVPARKVSVGAPKRTRSRFREDLPELPLSPPDSRRASLDTTPPIPEHPDMQQAANKDSRTATPTDGLGDEVMRQTPASQHEDGNGPSPAPHSISLASIDSEGSWLSGRITKRSPGSRQTLREQANSRAASTNGTEEELGITEDEYLSRLAPARLMRTMPSQRQPSATTDAIPSSDEDEPMDEGEVKLGSVNARRQPGVVHASSRPPAVSRMSHQGMVVTCDEEH